MTRTLQKQAHDSAVRQSSTLHHAAVITPREIAYGNGTAAPARPGVNAMLTEILDGTLGRFAPHSTIIIDGVKPAQVKGQAEKCRTAGWAHSDIDAWTLFHRPGRTVAVGLRDAMRTPHLGLLFDRDTDPGVVAISVDRYNRTSGQAWRGTPATSALNAIRMTWGNERYQPLWRHPKIPVRSQIGPLTWTRKLHGHEKDWGYVHTFDANAAYLGAAINAEVAWSELHHTGPQLFDPDKPGYWLLDLGTHTLSIAADPFRPPILGRVRDGRVWATTPYVKYLQELGDPVEVADSWTARAETRETGTRLHPAGTRTMRRWGENVRDALLHNNISPNSAVEKAIKRTYKDAVGGMQREGMRIFRPDWGHTVVDLWRATLLRRADRIRREIGYWPCRIATDSLSYFDSNPDPSILAEHVRVRGGLGGFKHVSTVTAEEFFAAQLKRVR